MIISQVNINKLSFQYDTHGEDIFKDVSFCIDTQWKLGLIGRNGRGKTTFLKLLMGEYEYSGKITSTVKFEYFPIKVDDKNQVALEVIRQSIAPFTIWEKQMEEYLKMPDKMDMYGEILDEFIDNDGYTINGIIEKEVRNMGMDPNILTKNFETLSCGEQTKLLLVGLFLRKNYFLLIDEPTNHLDTEGRESVAKYLASKKGFIVVSHDRAFLDDVIDHVLSINKANIEIQKGNFSTWQFNKDRQDEFEILENEKLQNDIYRLRQTAKQKSNWSYKLEATKKGNGPCDRGFIGHKAAKMMKRAKCIEARQNKAIEAKSKLLKNLDVSEKLDLSISNNKLDEVLEVQNLKINYGEEDIFDDLSFNIKQGERVWLRGKNGCGKSSIIKLLIGEDIPHEGYIKKTDNISYISQETSFLKGSIGDFIIYENVNEQHLKSTLFKLGFDSIQFGKNIEDWSEGQKKKLLIARSLCDKANLYIWDEPLNFIDVISRMQIEEIILSENPTILFVEHDTSFGEKIATKTIAL
ncbi:ribosomal protection-like ABC-F family protein [Romboutsia weinsteinii]|uniref:ribosomal protection-like ABC-F family protein n=1 Tax=Romboutsia weinsteinii TaxID=2020949 RepID=UPI002E8E3893|nr:ABC-F type ribosomal protection protein [Romboutsia weinsteinii]